MKVLKYNLEILTGIMFAMILYALIGIRNLASIQKIMVAFMLLFTLHEWEENRFPGGFSKLMAKFFGMDISKEKEKMSHIPVAILLIVITFIPFFWQNAIVALIPAFLGIMECMVHIIGIKLHKMDKPYTPGLITAILLLIMSIYTLIYFGSHGLTHGLDYLWGLLLMILCFVIMQRTVIAIFGLSYKDIVANVKKKFYR